ncbi:iron-siderophore ABC transporter substrate-binding protein [Pararhodobacter aggregans]|uniref:Iron-siderophore ABC transporter substrate-binding protein n=1 Tax=Pararhodobacter aggregans TaxID=404875 RepID=A0A2T7UM09_9RHOB|nr:iron complex transport system substrate-binding protein [Pararhodobacter aggregans]PVE45733.1 iron-siderophore ABC transporter substrate-binding protein [Pararhodobacter aggregans]
MRTVTQRRALRLLALVLALLTHPALACDGRLYEAADVLAAPLCLPDRIQRIAVLDPAVSLGMALELGLPVVAAPLTGMSDAALRQAAEEAGVQNLGSLLDPSLEALVAARPDLILGAAFRAETYLPVLSQIAPTALIVPTDWRAYYRAVARLTGTEARLDALMAPFEARLAAVAARVPDTPVSILRITSWDFQVYLDQPDAYAPFALLHELGVRRPAYETGPDPMGMRRPDWEDLGQLDGEILLYIIGGTNASATDGRWEEVTGNPLWHLLPAVAAGRVYPIQSAVWMEFSGIGSAHRVLDDVERLIIGAP